jgi:uncharacterized integral membrane protein
MKRNLVGTLALVVLSILIAAPNSFAQNTAKANVPFGFEVGKAQLPAGTYIVGNLEQGAILIRNGATSDAAMSLTQTEYSNKAHSPKLVFHKCGNHYFLAEVWGDGDTGKKLPTTKLEKELRASNSGTSSEQEIIIALR